MIDAIKKLKISWDAAKEEVSLYKNESNDIHIAINAIDADIAKLMREFTKYSITDTWDGDAIKSISTNIRVLTERKTILYGVYKISRAKYNAAWPKVVKIETNIKRQQERYWLDLDLSILPMWEH